MRPIIGVLVVLVCFVGVFGQRATEGSLFAISKQGTALGACPLKTTAVKTDISGFIARVNVRQEFQNSFTDPIEAIYVFPLSQNGAVDRMTMTIGTRVINGKIMKREEARQVYETAKNEGRAAALLDQERPNIFTQSVANIMPGETVIVEISYVETLKYEDGAYEFVFPMTVGPRYIPAGVKDANKITPPVAETRAGHDISMEVNLNAGVPVEEIRSTSHDIDQVNYSPNNAKITLRDEKTIPNKDFILRYDVTGKRIEDAVLTHRDDRGGFFTMILQPPDKVANEDRTPKEIVFVLDTSGSMSGFPIEKAKEAMKLSLDGLYPDDTFNLITFAGDTRILFDRPMSATKANLNAAQAFLSQQRGYGGTEMMKAIKAALDPSDASDHLRIVCFMTDGYVGNEPEIIAEVQKHPNARVFSFGIGGSVNRFLLDKIAEEGRGEATYVLLNDDGSKAAKKFYERVRTPLLTDLSIDWNGLPVADVYPGRLTDLFTAKPVVIHGRYTKGASGTIKLKGKVAGQAYERSININLPESEAANDVLSTLWARTRIEDLSSERLKASIEAKGVEIDKQIENIGIEFGLMTSFTSFVAVEDRVVNQNGKPTTVQVPVELPEGMRRMANNSGFEAEYGGATGGVVNVETTINSQSAELLPRGLNFSSVLKVSPGTRPEPRSGQFQVDGASGSENTFIVDGQEVKNVTFTGPSDVFRDRPYSPERKSRATSGGLLNGRAVKLPKPEYPAAATAINAKGDVRVQVTIDETGNVTSAEAVSGDPLLRAAAVKAALEAKFVPTTLSGKPIKVSGFIVYKFSPSKTDVATDKMKTAPITPEDKRALLLSEKFHAWLVAVCERIIKNDATPTPRESQFVRDGKAEIKIELTSRSAEVIEKLKAAGFELVTEKGKTTVVGRIALDKLASLAEIDEVRLVLPKT